MHYHSSGLGEGDRRIGVVALQVLDDSAKVTLEESVGG